MDQPMGFAHFLAHADGVAKFILGVLLIMSIGTWYLIATKGVQTFLSRRRSHTFLTSFWDSPNLEAVALRLRETGITEPFSHLLHHGFTAVEHHRGCGENKSPGALMEAGTTEEFLTRALKRAIEEDKTRLEFGLTFLATVASSAPFVGLFGTVWGIYHALIAIGMSGQGTLDKVAGPVGEALIMTGLGLAVAIPSAIAYNAFARANRNTLAQLNSFAYDVFAFLSTGAQTVPMLRDVKATSERVIARVQANARNGQIAEGA